MTKYLDAEELDIKKLKELRVVVEQKGAEGSATKVKSEPDDKQCSCDVKVRRRSQCECP